MRNFRIVGAFVLTIGLCATSPAHDTWLIPDRFVVAPDTEVLLNLRSTNLRRSSRTGIEWESAFTALTFRIGSD